VVRTLKGLRHGRQVYPEKANVVADTLGKKSTGLMTSLITTDEGC